MQFAGWTEADIENYEGPTPDIVAGLAENIKAKLESTYCVSEVGVRIRLEARTDQGMCLWSHTSGRI